MTGRLVFLVVALVAARPALAGAPAPQPPQPPPAEPVVPPPATAPQGPDDDAPEDLAAAARGDPDTRLHEDAEFGQLIQIERIEITGNTATQPELIERALPISPGDVLHASDRRLRDARFKVLALGFFRDVNLRIHKGSQRGQVVIEVNVIERGTVVLNRLWFGTTDVSPWWFGADLGERNLLGLGIAVGGGFIYAGHGDLAEARDQYAGELRAAMSSVGGTRWGASAAATLVHGSEPFRTRKECDASAGDPPSPSPPPCAFSYRRLGARFGASYELSALTTLSLGLRLEAVDAALPAAPSRMLDDGSALAVDLHLDPDASRVVTASLSFDRDTRPDPILPHAGARILASAELGSALLGGSYDFATVFGSYEHYWPVHGDKHAIAIKLAGGIVVGDAPRFDRIHIADVDHMLTPRALGLVLSTARPLGILATAAGKPSYGDLGGSVTAEYVFQLFRGSGKQRVYGGDVFFGAGLWGLAERNDLRVRDTGLLDALPIDVYLDAGLRIDTDIGVFELTIANALGRLR
ncbi:MAG TPA: BamA/TamA family outer membrane protein [Kofleriaceae bacterium]|nr:BamA/TamA family outer membrane protein [Kofleriaceae bacterium]